MRILVVTGADEVPPSRKHAAGLVARRFSKVFLTSGDQAEVRRVIVGPRETEVDHAPLAPSLAALRRSYVVLAGTNPAGIVNAAADALEAGHRVVLWLPMVAATEQEKDLLCQALAPQGVVLVD